jgi:hypothetical protein
MFDFSWTVFFVTVSFVAIAGLSWLMHKAGPPDE